MNDHCSQSIAASHLLDLILIEAFLIIAHDVLGSCFEVEELSLHHSVLDDILHIAIAKGLATDSGGLVEKDGIINNLANGEVLIVVDHCHVRGLINCAVIIVENAFQFGEPG